MQAKSKEVPELNKDWLYQKYIVEKIDRKEISRILSVKMCTLEKYLYKFKLFKIDRFPKILLEQQKSFLYGCLLGDGLMRQWKYKNNAYFSVTHGIKQKDYLYYKYELMKNLCGMSPKKRKHWDKRFKKYYEDYHFYTTTNPLFTEIWKKFYVDNVKVVTEEILSNIDEFALAIWYMDDGSISYRKHILKNGTQTKYFNSITLATCGFTYDEHLLMQMWFKERWNIEIKIRPHCGKFILVITNKENMEKFINIVQSYIIPLMQYKIGA